MSFAWITALSLVSLFCLIRGVLDLKAKRYLFGVLGLLSGIMLVLMPVQSHSVSVDLPPAPASPAR
jgi:hypothetical protein